MTPSSRLLCVRCGQPIPDRRRVGVAEEVTGLRVNRSGGGANQIKSWKGLGRWVCHVCMSMGDEPATASMF